MGYPDDFDSAAFERWYGSDARDYELEQEAQRAAELAAEIEAERREDEERTAAWEAAQDLEAFVIAVEGRLS